MKNSIKISIVLPIHNEFKNLKLLINSWHSELKNKIDHEFILVEDGSTDGTKELIKQLEKNFPIVNLSSMDKRGYTKAVLEGINASSGDYILCTDSDNQIKVQSLIENLDNLPEENEFLFGARSPRKDPLNRIIYSRLFKILHIILFNSKLSDPSCPFVIGKNSEFKKLPKKILLNMKEGFWWGFVGVCKKLNLKLNEVKIEHFYREKGVAGYQFNKLPGIILRNTLGLIKIKISKI
jgi:glycosyltransferase involved in cell wall biosynthesis